MSPLGEHKKLSVFMAELLLATKSMPAETAAGGWGYWCFIRSACMSVRAAIEAIQIRSPDVFIARDIDGGAFSCSFADVFQTIFHYCKLYIVQ